jgi:hypothetical protein
MTEEKRKELIIILSNKHGLPSCIGKKTVRNYTKRTQNNGKTYWYSQEAYLRGTGWSYTIVLKQRKFRCVFIQKNNIRGHDWYK